MAMGICERLSFVCGSVCAVITTMDRSGNARVLSRAICPRLGPICTQRDAAESGKQHLQPQ